MAAPSFGGIQLNQNGETGVMAFGRGTFGQKGEQFLVVFDAKDLIPIRTISLADAHGAIAPFVPLLFDGSVVDVGFPATLGNYYSVGYFQCQIGENEVCQPGVAKHFQMEESWNTRNRGRFNDGFDSVAGFGLVNGKRVIVELIPVKANDAEQKALRLCLVENESREGHDDPFSESEIAKVFKRALSDYGSFEIFTATTNMIPLEYRTCWISDSFRPIDDLFPPPLTWKPWNSSYSRSSPLHLFLHLLSIPTRLIASESIRFFNDPLSLVTTCQLESKLPYLLEASAPAPCFVISVISHSGATLISHLTGIEYIESPPNSLLAGVNTLPVSSSLTYLLGLLFTAADALSQAIAFLAATSVSNTVILDVNDIPEFWRKLSFCCDVICENFSVTFPLSAVNVIIIGNEQPLDLTGIPTTSAIHSLVQVCRFHFAPPDQHLDGLDAKVGSRPVGNVMPLLRKAAALFAANFIRPGGLVIPSDVFILSQRLKCDWLCRIAADAGDRDAQFDLGKRDANSDEFLRRAADQGHTGAQLALFRRDPSRIEYLERAAAADNAEAILERAVQTGDLTVSIPLLERAQALGNEAASGRLFELISNGDRIPARVVTQQARFWLNKDPAKALVCYRIAERSLGHNFQLYRSILLACNDSYEPIPEDADLETLQAALQNGNLLAASRLAELADSSEERVAILKSGIPAVTSFFGLMNFHHEITTESDLVYEYARDGILATRFPDQSACKDAKAVLFQLLATNQLSDFINKRIEIANLMLEESENGFKSDNHKSKIKSFLGYAESESPGVLLIRARITGNSWTVRDNFDQALQFAQDDLLQKNEILFHKALYDQDEVMLLEVAQNGYPPAQVEYAIGLLKTHELEPDKEALVVRFLTEASQASGDPSARFILSLMMHNGIFGVKCDRVAAHGIWKTINPIELEPVLNKHLFLLRQAQVDFFCVRIHEALTDEHYFHALYHLADLYRAQGSDDDDLLFVLLKQIYLTPRFNAIKHFPNLLDVFVKHLERNERWDLRSIVLDRYEKDPPLNPNHEVQALGWGRPSWGYRGAH